MSTIPLTSSYTVIGGAKKKLETGLSAVILNRGTLYPRRALFASLEKAGFDSVVSVERPGTHYDVYELSNLFPFVKFILLRCPFNLGDAVNIAAREITSPLFFVLWNDMKILYSTSASKISDRAFAAKRLCTAPVFQNSEFETLPAIVNPSVSNKIFEIKYSAPGKEGTATLYPFDAAGIYDRERFFNLGCFDPRITSEYWQLADFGFRAWLCGEEIRCTQLVRLRYERVKEREDASVNESYWRFFLKNLSPVLRKSNDGRGMFFAHLPLKNFFHFLFKAGQGPLNAARFFFEERKTLEARKRARKFSAKEFLRQWGAL